jgi:ribonuclease Z
MLDICLLGTGGMMPLPNRWLSSVLIRYKGKMLLIDCGEGTQLPIKMLGWGFKAIDAICFTHYHADHIAGLPGLLLTIGNSGREEPMVLMGPTGIEEVVKGLTVISPELPFKLNLIELSDIQNTEIKTDNFYIKSLPVDHALPCLSYSIDIKRQGKFEAERAKELNIPVNYWKRLQKGESIEVAGKVIEPQMLLGEARKGLKVSYCTDTRPTVDLVDFIHNSDLFICEGMYADEDKYQKAVEKKHMLFSEAARLAAEGEVKEMWLTHYSPSIFNPEDYLLEVRSIFSNTITGKDLMVKKLNFKD